ncbi:LuxR C-terminal-related transcriptional regulator [Streptomyces sp. NBC_00193]|uniref:LuxR C-terminal-related transcriptional regulator n=1 Tax=Streptomyces sp. NBC_00193 TaxID=2975675 RepID=UPI002B1E287C|nr:LuxR C-terminal-related transcriptional regulator [Streptomyces sp. NBC_00193]
MLAPPEPTGPGEDSAEPGEEDRLLLALLVSGLKDEAIARQLGWSVRTMRRRMSRLHDQLGAANRFQAGAVAARRKRGGDAGNAPVSIRR